MRNLDKIKGCLIGGAVGDALGYPVEFLEDFQIFERYGQRGITDYALTDGVAQISDDTQMTLFTATALLFGKTRAMTRGICNLLQYVNGSYINWYMTQFPDATFMDQQRFSWLLNVKELYSRRAPGNTCLSAIHASMRTGSMFSINNPANKSKGCGGVMRVAPIGLYANMSDCSDYLLQTLGAEAAALTHGHPLGYIPAAALVHIICRLAGEEGISITDAVESSIVAIGRMFEDNEYLPDFISLMLRAMELASDREVDELDAIRELGQGWVAEEALAISVYCAIRHEDSFEDGVIAAVNHSGDSDSTGAITGNILGAHLGFSAIPNKYITDLELADVISEIAEDMYHDCPLTQFSPIDDPTWSAKYIDMTYEPTK